MTKMLVTCVLVAFAIAVVPAVADQDLITSRSDFLTVPSGDILGDGAVDLNIASIGPDFVGGEDDEIVGIGVGVRQLEVTAYGLLNGLDDDDGWVGALKYQVDAGDEDVPGFGRTRAAIFLCNIMKDEKIVPGFAATNLVTSNLDVSASTWYNDGWEAGGAVRLYLTDGIAPTVEYSSETDWGYGVDLAYKGLYGRVVLLDTADTWYLNVGKVFVW
jgi:hypothetical protein